MDANALNDLGKTPLHEAVEVNSVHVARLLLDSGADVNARGPSINDVTHERGEGVVQNVT